MAKGFWTGVRLPSPPPKNGNPPKRWISIFWWRLAHSKRFAFASPEREGAKGPPKNMFFGGIEGGESKVQALPTGTACWWGPGSGRMFYGAAKYFIQKMG